MTWIEWGVFNDEGCIGAQMGETEARAEAAQYKADGDEWAYAAAVCTEHEGEPADTCEECATDDGEGDDDDD